MRKLVLSGLFAAFSSAALAGDITIETALGPIDFPATPEKIAVFDIAAIDTLAALGVEMAGLPEKLYVSYLDEAKASSVSVGTIFEPNFEELAILAPEAIIAGSRSSEQVAALSKIAPTADMTITGDGIVDQAKARITTYGELFDVQTQAETLLSEIDTKIAQAQDAVAGKGNGLIVLTNGTKISAYGLGSRFGWLHETIGLPLAAEGLEAETHGMAVSFEFIAQTNPDWLLVVDRGSAIGKGDGAAKATLDNPIVAQTNAAQTGQILYLTAAPLYISGGGATAILSTLDEIISAFSKAQG